MLLLAFFSYINFMSKFLYPIFAIFYLPSVFYFWKTKLYFQLNEHKFKTPMLPVLLTLAFLIWIAENISTFYKIWLYPSQVEAWHMVGWGKLGSWYLLLLLSLVLVLKILGHRDNQGNWNLR